MADETVNVGLGMGEPENVPQLQLGAEQEQGVPAIELNIEVPDTVYAKRSEAWAIGTMGGVPVSSGDPTYHNNSKYYSEQSRDAALQAVADAKASGEFDGEKGDPGKDFHIAKTFASIAAMMAYTGTDIEENDFAMIDTGSVQDVDTGKLYCYEPEKTPKWSYIGDLSGAQGIKGETGTGIDSISLNADYTLTIYLDDGNSYTTASIRGAQGQQGEQGVPGIPGTDGADGADGADGVNAYVHIRYASAQPTQDSDMHTTPDDWMGIYSGTAATAPTTYTSYTWYKIKGETGSAASVYGNTIDMSSTDSTKVSAAIAAKLDANQGAGNAGKALGIDDSGAVVPVPFSGDDFTGATASTAGTHGYVPAPAAGDQAKVLTGGGTWQESPGAKLVAVTYTMTSATGSFTATINNNLVTAEMEAVQLYLSNRNAFKDSIYVTTSAGAVTITCADVDGSSDIRVLLQKVIADPTAITSTEFNVLDNRIGDLSDLETTDQTSMVNAVNEVAEGVATNSQAIANINTQIASETKSFAFGTCYKFGKLVVLSFNNLSTSMTTSGYTLPYTAKYVTSAAARYYNGSSNDSGSVKVDDTKVYLYGSGGSLANGTYITGQIVYMTDD